MNTSWRNYFEFLDDYLQYDLTKWLSLDESETNLIISTWLNKQNIKKLAYKIIDSLIEKISLYKSDDYWDFANTNNDEIFCLIWLFRFYTTISWVSIQEKWWLYEFKRGISEHIREKRFGKDRKITRIQERFLNELLSTNKQFQLSETIISKIREQSKKTVDSNSWSDIDIRRESSLMNYDKLNLLQAMVISKHLSMLWNESIDWIVRYTWDKTTLLIEN